MNNMTKIWITTAAMIVCFSACKKENPNSTSIIGRWELKNHNIISNGQLAYNFNYQDGNSYIYHFGSDKTCMLYNSEDSIYAHGSYSLDSNRLLIHLIIDQSNLETVGTSNCVISSTTLTLSFSGNDMAGEYTETFIYNRLSYR